MVTMIDSALNMTVEDLDKLGPRAKADLRKRTCSRCLAHHHDLCTAPETCAHYLCQEYDDAPAATAPTAPEQLEDEDDEHHHVPYDPALVAEPGARNGNGVTPGPATATPSTHDGELIEQDEDVVVWEDPPSKASGPRRSAVITETQERELREHPGVWGRVRVFTTAASAYAAASAMRRNIRPRPAGPWSFRAAKIHGKQGGVWARYDGDPVGDE